MAYAVRRACNLMMAAGRAVCTAAAAAMGFGEHGFGMEGFGE